MRQPGRWPVLHAEPDHGGPGRGTDGAHRRRPARRAARWRPATAAGHLSGRLGPPGVHARGESAMSAPERRPTLADVAAVAGVSAKTVSNVLLSRRYVSATTEDRVRAAIEAVGYQVNPAGRSLASGRSGRIAVVVPMLYQPYFAEVAERLILALAEHGLTSTLRLAWDAQAELDAVTGATTADADGVIICPHFFIGDMLAGVRPTRPTVQLGGSPNPLMDTVLMGEREGFRAVTAHLLDSGRERLALVWNQNSEGAPSGGRFAGFLAAHEERQLRPDEALFGAGSDWDR